jgi:LysM repeat protein
MKHILIVLIALLALVSVSPQSVEAQAATCSVNTSWQLYTVVSGDTVAKIARRYNSTINAIVTANCLANANQIYVGQQLRVPPTGNPGSQQTATAATYQAFERGFMIWRADTGLITVFNGGGSNGSYGNFPVFTYSFLPENGSGAAPTGLIKPIFGFGKVWWNFEYIRKAIGWAKGSEQGYAAVFTTSSSNQIVTLPNGQNVSMANGMWTYTNQIPPTVTPGPSVVNIAASYQPFEKGFMVWMSDSSNIFAFYGNTPNDGPFGGAGSYAIFPSTSYGSLPANPATEPTPAARFHPMMGFGKVWYNFPTTRSRLGWALQFETGYVTTLTYNTVGLVSLTLPDGRVVSFSSSSWNTPRIAGGSTDTMVTMTPSAMATTPSVTLTNTPIPPTLTPTPPVTVTLNPNINIASFTASQGAGRSVTSNWEITGSADIARLSVHGLNGELLFMVDNQPLVGSHTFDIPANITQGTLRLILTAVNIDLPGQGSTIVAEKGIDLEVSVASAYIASFTANPTAVTIAGSTISLSWEITGANKALIEVYDSETATTPVNVIPDLPLVGSQAVQLPASILEGNAKIVLWATAPGPNGFEPVLRLSSSTLLIPVSVALPTVTTNGAQQSFDNGFMVWRGDTSEVLVFYSFGSVNSYPLSSYQSLPDNPVFDPMPDGKVRPINAFGRVWGNNADVRQWLGWANAGETGNTLNITTNPDGSTTYILGDGRTVKVQNGNWQ